MTEATTRTFTSTSKDVLRRITPDFLLKQRSIVLRLGPRAGRTYARLRLLDVIGMRRNNQRLVPPSARSFTFVCFGNIMRSAMSEFFMKEEIAKAGILGHVRISSAGMHATPGREAHPWAQEASAELGISLAGHRARQFTREMVEQSDCILAMDFQNKAELLTLFPDYEKKIYMLSAYAEGPWRYREIPDPYLGDAETTRFCARELQTCIRNLIASVLVAEEK